MSAVIAPERRAGLAEEHAWLRHEHGIVDWSGAGVFEISGDRAVDFLDAVCTRSAAFLVEERTLPALMLRDDGSIVAAVDVFCHRDRYVILVWPDQRAAVAAHLAAYASARAGVTVTDRSDATAVLGIEGPGSGRVVDALVEGGGVAQIAYKSFTVGRWPEGDLIIARIGVTAEFGYTLMLPAAQRAALHDRLVELGAHHPCGRDAVDVCRMESRFVDLERDLPDPRATPFDVGLQWMVDVTHEFTGKTALLERWERRGMPLPVCFTTLADQPLEPGVTVLAGDEIVGVVTNSVWSPGLRRVIGIAHIDAEVAVPGLELATRGGLHDTPISTCSGPFVVPTSVAAGRG